MDQDWDASLRGDLEHRREPLVGRGELLRARVQLDAARPGVEAAPRLLDRRLVQVEAHERDQAPAAALRERKGAVVRRAEGGMAVGLVEAEHERARDAVALHQRLELVVVADHPVDVVAEVEVRVEDLCALGDQAAQIAVVALEQLACPVAWLHGFESRY